MKRILSEMDGIVFGYTEKASKSLAGGGRTYKSMNYHRVNGYKRGKAIWADSVDRLEEAQFFSESDLNCWRSDCGSHWWVAHNASREIGISGQRVAFFPVCINHPGPWHGYPVSPRLDSHYDIPYSVIDTWEDSGIVDDLIAGRMRKGRI